MVYGQVVGRDNPFLTADEARDHFCPVCYPEAWDMMMDDFEAAGLRIEWHVRPSGY